MDSELSQARSSHNLGHRRLILVVDDEASVRLILKRMLERWGYTVVIAQDGQSAFAEFQCSAPDLIITDLRMEGGDGLELIQAVRRCPWQGKIVAMSGSYSSEDWRLRAIELGANAILDKPFTPDGLHSLIEALLTPRNAQTETRRAPDPVRGMG